jgi:hypothetical protein
MRRSYLVGAGAIAAFALAVGATMAFRGPSASKEVIQASCPQPRDTVIPLRSGVSSMPKREQLCTMPCCPQRPGRRSCSLLA